MLELPCNYASRPSKSAASSPMTNGADQADWTVLEQSLRLLVVCLHLSYHSGKLPAPVSDPIWQRVLAFFCSEIAVGRKTINTYIKSHYIDMLVCPYHHSQKEIGECIVLSSINLESKSDSETWDVTLPKTSSASSMAMKHPYLQWETHLQMVDFPLSLLGILPSFLEMASKKKLYSKLYCKLLKSYTSTTFPTTLSLMALIPVICPGRCNLRIGTLYCKRSAWLHHRSENASKYI